MAPTNFPVQLASFIGREQEIAQLRQLLHRPDVRLATITGPGGVGKTSLALQVAHELGNTFTEGAHFISLAAVREPTQVISTLAQSLGIPESPDRLVLSSLKDFLRDRHMLLLIDNFEQVIPAAPLLTELLATCGELKLLVTSREALRLRGEREFPLAPLELLDLSHLPEHPSFEALLQYPSIALFIQRAQSSQPDFQLTADNATAVAEICARLDGLPLAIELAAARIKLLPPQAMLERLQESSLQLLTGGARDAPVRQQALHNTLQWSYDLLNADEQRAFRRLAVFTNGCTLEAATRVIGSEARNVLEQVMALINKSLVRQAESDGEPRLGMLETLREFGLEQLDQKNELEAMQRAHAEYYLMLAEEAELYLTGRQQKAWLNRLGREQENLRAALRWGFDHRAVDIVLRLVGALWQFWFLRGQWSEGRRWLEEALTLTTNPDVDMALRAKVLYAAATLIRRQYDFARARALCEQSITLYRELGDKEGLLTALLEWCRILDYQGYDEHLHALLPEMLALADDLPDIAIKAEVYASLHIIDHDSIRSGMAAHYLAESERIYRALDHHTGLAKTLFYQGVAADYQGDTARGQAFRDEADRLAAMVEDHHLWLVLQSGRAVSAWQSGDDTSARKYIEQLLFASGEIDVSTGQKVLYLGQRVLFLGILAAVLHRQGLSVWAARVYGLADNLSPISESPRMGGELFDAFRKRSELVRAEVRAQLGDEAFSKALVEGQAMNMEDLLAIPHPSPSPASPRSDQAPYEPLTGRELEVLRLLEQDLSNHQIAERLVVSRRTVDAHLRSIYAKLGVRSRDAAIRIAGKHGLI